NTSTVFINGSANHTINAEPNFNNLIINKSGSSAIISGNVTANYIALYNGTLTFSGGETLRSTTDFVFLGATAVDSNALDGWAGPTRLSDPTTYTGSFNAGGGSPTIQVDRDFYVNGCSMTGTANWNLIIPDNDDNVRKARAYGNINVSYSRANYWVSAIEPEAPNNPKDLGNNDRWDFTRATIVSVETVSDKVIRVILNKVMENSNNDIWLSVTDGTNKPITYDNNPNKIFIGSYNNIDCQVGNETTGKGDMGDATKPIYILCGETWNTDASGDSVGNANSTDRPGVHKNILINLILKKGALRDARKNQIAAVTYNNTLDKCEPVLISATLGDEAEGVNTFNYLRLTYSEPIKSNGITTSPKNSDNGSIGISNANIGGALTTAGTFKGFGSAVTPGDIETFSDSNTGTTSGRDDSNTVYKDGDSRVFTIRLGGNVADGGCLRGSVLPSGMFNSLTNITDMRGNNLINGLSYLPNTNYRPTIAGTWITTPPDFGILAEDVKTNEKSNLTNGFIDNLIINFTQDVQVYDNETSFGTSSIVWNTTNYTVSNHDHNKNTIKNSFNLDIIENKAANVYGDTDATPTINYDQNSNFKIISNLGRVEMFQNTNKVAMDNCSPVITKVSFGIDDPSFNYHGAPYIRQWEGDTKDTDPGATPDFSLGAISPPTQKTYHNYVLFRYSEPITNFNGVTVDLSSDGYNFSSDQKSNSSLGDFETSSNTVSVKGFGTFKGDIKVDSESNFILRDDARTTFLHIAGFHDGTKFVGHITNQNKATVPNSTGLYHFTTIDEPNVKDVMNLPLKQKNIVNNKDVTIDYIKNWDITPPDFRYIEATMTYRGDPASSDKTTSKLSDGATYGSPFITSIEFAMTEAIRDLDTSADMSEAFSFRFYKNGVDYNPATGLKYSTNVNKLGDLINQYNGTFVADGDPNDQGISIYFDKTFGMTDEAQIKWTYKTVSGKIISDLRGNMLPDVPKERLSLENAPPYIKETRSVVGSNKMYVEFNEPVLTRTYQTLTINEFNYTDAINNTNLLTDIEKIG
ncbi:MAG TPA: hypothetical protein PK771_09045, partial [Spirochaetota bacterium]|nr:hypothetical protein [Spirochaetota bacterium]